MPDYTDIYRHGLRATDPITGQEVTGTLDPAKRYNLEFTSEAVEPSTLTPTQIREVIRDEQLAQQPKMPEWTEYTDINDQAESDYKTGQLAVQNEYLEDMKKIDQLQPGSQQHVILSSFAASKLQSRMGELNTKKQKWDMTRQRLRQEVTLAPPERKGMEMDFYSKNPIFEPSKVELPEQISPQEQIIQKRLDYIKSLETRIALGQATDVEQDDYKKLVTGIAPVREAPASSTERMAIAEARSSIDALNNLRQLYKIGGFGTAAPIAGRVAGVRGLWGGTTQAQEDFMAATAAFKNAIIRQITGAQLSEAEAKRIVKQIPDITDPPARWQAKWQQSLKNIQMLQQRKLEILKQSGLRVPQQTEDTAVAQAAEELGF